MLQHSLYYKIKLLITNHTNLQILIRRRVVRSNTLKQISKGKQSRDLSKESKKLWSDQRTWQKLIFVFCFLVFEGGCKTTFIAASNTAFTFCKTIVIIITSLSLADLSYKRLKCHSSINGLVTCCVFELHSIYANAPISFLSSWP